MQQTAGTISIIDLIKNVINEIKVIDDNNIFDLLSISEENIETQVLPVNNWRRHKINMMPGSGISNSTSVK